MPRVERTAPYAMPARPSAATAPTRASAQSKSLPVLGGSDRDLAACRLALDRLGVADLGRDVAVVALSRTRARCTASRRGSGSPCRRPARSGRRLGRRCEHLVVALDPTRPAPGAVRAPCRRPGSRRRRCRRTEPCRPRQRRACAAGATIAATASPRTRRLRSRFFLRFRIFLPPFLPTRLRTCRPSRDGGRAALLPSDRQ